MWFKNLFKKRKHYNIVDLEKVKSDYGSPRLTLYEPLTARVIPLDEVQSFVFYETNEQTLIMIAEQGFKLEQLDGNWWMCRKKK